MFKADARKITFGEVLKGFLQNMNIEIAFTFRIGRKKTFFLSALFHSASGIGLAFAPNIEGFIALRFINGAANAGLFMSAFVIGKI